MIREVALVVAGLHLHDQVTVSGTVKANWFSRELTSKTSESGDE